MNSPRFSPDEHRRVAAAVAAALDTYPTEALSAAAGGLKVSAYKQPGELPFREPMPSTAPFASVFPSVAAWISAVRAGAPSAVEAAFDVLSGIDPEATAGFASAVLDLDPWRAAKEKAALALSRSASKEAFARLLDALGDAPRAGFLLTQSPYPGGCALVLERLKQSPIWQYDPVKLPTEEAWSAMSEDAREEAQDRVDAASAAHKSSVVDPVQDCLGYLGAKRCAEAQPVIAKLYAEHPSRKVRLSAGHALIALGDAESLGLLISLAGDHDERRPWFAVKAHIVKDPAGAVAALGGDALTTDAGRQTVEHAFEILNIDADDRAKEGALAKAWALQDPRWLDVAARWVKDRNLGTEAERILDRFPKDQVSQALAAAKGKGKSAPKKAASKKGAAAAPAAGNGALALWQAGDGPGAWHRLAALGAAARDPAHVAEAREVAALTMKRAREDLERIVERLQKAGYRFAHPGRVLTPPPADIGVRLDELEASIGLLPLSLRAAIEHIGSVSLAGDHPAWPKSAHAGLRPVKSERDLWLTDPLVIVPIETMLDDTEGWTGGRPFALAFSGDALTNAGMSGGTCSVETPCQAADAPIAGAARPRTFVEHLRLALKYGGFAGFEAIADRPQALIDTLVAGLAPV